MRDTSTVGAPLDLSELERRLDLAVEAGHKRELMTVSGAIGELLRLNRRDGRQMLQEALNLARQLEDPQAIIANRIRLATARFYQGEHALAELELREIIAEIETRSDPTYLDYAWQHLGKCIAEQERYAEAISCFHRALLLRNDPALRASSEQAIGAAALALPPANEPASLFRFWRPLPLAV